MPARSPGGILETLISEADAALRVLLNDAAPGRPAPRPGQPAPELAAADRALAARLMRVNHAGEIAAQALYRGQALLARDPALRQELLAAARDEHDHLAWCAERVHGLGERVSLLSPLWYAGSLAIGMAAAAAGDRASMGFLVETERQVSEHLTGHLGRLPAADARSREIVAQMRTDEERHGHTARNRGAAELPPPVREAMRLAAAVMTTVSFWL